MLRITVFSLMLLSLSGCLSSWDRYGMTAEYDQMIADFDTQGGYERFDNPADYRVLLWVCEAYFQQRERIQYEECTNRMWPLIPEDWYQINDHDMKANLLSRKAILSLELQDYEKADQYIERAKLELSQGKSIESAGTAHIATISRIYQVDGIVSAFLEQPEQAEAAIRTIEAALATESVWGGRDQMLEEFEFEIRRDAIGAVLVAMHEYDRAVQVYASTYDRKTTFNSFMESVSTFGLNGLMEDATEDLLKDFNNSTKIPHYFAIGKANLEAGNIDVAQKVFDDLLAMPVIIGFSEIYSATSYERGRIARMEGDHLAAANYFEQAIVETEKQRTTVNTEAGKIGLAGDTQSIYWDMVQTQIALDRPGAAFNYAERAKSRALVDLLAEKEAFGSDGSDRRDLASQAIDIFEETDQDIQVYSKQDYDGLMSGTRAVAIQKQAITATTDRELASLLTVSSTDLADIQSQLGADETLIEYFGNEISLVVFVVEQESISAVMIDAVELAADVSMLRKGLQNPLDTQHRDYSQKLYDRLLKPVLTADMQKLIIVPHGSLHYLPFSALGTDNDALIHNYSYRILPSASTIPFLISDNDDQRRLLILGNPELNDPALDLPYAEKEAKAIARAQRGSKVLLNSRATETEVRNISNNFNQLHIASHGVFDTDSPLNSRLLLAGDEINDGNLTVSELYNLDLNADIVTLSACETGLGEVANGDDVVGFTRGFLFAGANTIVSSLWQVDDLATMELMLKFYEELESTTASEALKRAQQHLIVNGFSHPYYWAAFQVTGADA